MKSIALIAGFVAVTLVGAEQTPETAGKAAAKKIKRADVFAPGKVWTVHLRIGADEYELMQPKGGGNFMLMGKGPILKKEPAPKKPAENQNPPPKEDVRKSKLMGYEFVYVKADLEFEGTLVTDVAVRYKGNSTYSASAQGNKRPFKVDVNHYVEDQNVHGLGMLALANNIFDATKVREPLSYAVFRAAGVPASRTAYVKLHLSVPNKFNNSYLGLYTLIEPIDKNFLRAHFDNDQGMLLKPEKIQGLPYFGERWSAYKDRYNPKREPTPEQAKCLIEFTKLVNQSSDTNFRKRVGEFLDVDGFLKYLAVSSLIGNVDSFVGLGHNYYLYLSPKTNQFHFIPWDLDLTFGSFAMGGSDQIEWSIAEPYMGKNRLVQRVLAMKEHNEAYRGHLKKLTDTTFSSKEIRSAIAQFEATVKSFREPKGGGGFGFGGPKSDLRQFVSRRVDSVVAQLDGRSEGKALQGFGGGFGDKGPKKGEPFKFPKKGEQP